MPEGYSLADLELAKSAQATVEARDANYDGNNPHKFDTLIGDARDKVHEITLALKAAGALPRTDHEILEAELDALHPKAESKDIVDHNGVRYQRRFSPGRLILSRKTVLRWDKSWVKV